MKRSLHLTTLLLARLRQSLHRLKEALGEWVPRHRPVLIPIPIPAERRPRQSNRRHPLRDA